MPIEPRAAARAISALAPVSNGADGQHERAAGLSTHGDGTGPEEREHGAPTDRSVRSPVAHGSALLGRLAEADDEEPEGEGGRQRQADPGCDGSARRHRRARARRARPQRVRARCRAIARRLGSAREAGRRRGARRAKSPRWAPRFPSHRRPGPGRGSRARSPGDACADGEQQASPGRVASLAAIHTTTPPRPRAATRRAPSGRPGAVTRIRRENLPFPTAPPRRAPGRPLHRGSDVADGAGGGLSVELVRVIQHGGLGGARSLPVVMDGNGVEQLGPNPGVEARRPSPRSGAGRDGRVRAGALPRSGGMPDRDRARSCGRCRVAAPRRPGGRDAAAGGVAPSRGTGWQRRPCARGARRRSRGGRPPLRRAGRGVRPGRARR